MSDEQTAEWWHTRSGAYVKQEIDRLTAERDVARMHADAYHNDIAAERMACDKMRTERDAANERAVTAEADNAVRLEALKAAEEAMDYAGSYAPHCVCGSIPVMNCTRCLLESAHTLIRNALGKEQA